MLNGKLSNRLFMEDGPASKDERAYLSPECVQVMQNMRTFLTAAEALVDAMNEEDASPANMVAAESMLALVLMSNGLIQNVPKFLCAAKERAHELKKKNL